VSQIAAEINLGVKTISTYRLRILKNEHEEQYQLDLLRDQERHDSIRFKHGSRHSACPRKQAPLVHCVCLAIPARHDSVRKFLQVGAIFTKTNYQKNPN
jgi:hypothetical protein